MEIVDSGICLYVNNPHHYDIDIPTFIAQSITLRYLLLLPVLIMVALLL